MDLMYWNMTNYRHAIHATGIVVGGENLFRDQRGQLQEWFGSRSTTSIHPQKAA
jgi:hypothetical protein